MTRKTFLIAGFVMLAVGTAVRLNNAFTLPVLRGYDAFPHFTYIWFLSETGRVPLANAGWQFFQPPLYYAIMAWVWETFTGLDPIFRLHLGTAIIAVLGLSQAFVGFAIVRRYFPEDRWLQLLAAGLMLFLPVHLYGAGFLGNEGLNAAICSVAIGALMWTLAKPSLFAAAVLGAALGFAMLVKFTAFVIVAAAFATIGLRALVRRELAQGVKMSLVAGAVMLTICGWYYARNVAEYGTPFQMSRKELFLRHVENAQPQAKRSFLEYILFDPLIVYRPEWPRGASVRGARPEGADYSPLRESILTGLYANTWFDGFGGFALPPVTRSESSRRAGQILLTLAVLPTLVMIYGFFAAIGKLRRDGWDDTIVAMLFLFAAMAAVLIQGTRTVPTQAAVKATYLTPISVVFAFWFAFGLYRIGQRDRRYVRAVAAYCAVLATASVAVFSHGTIGRDWFEAVSESRAAHNLRGVISYAGGDRERARELFESSARRDWHLGYENLAMLAGEEGRYEEALYHLRYAAWLQPHQSFGTPEDRQEYNLMARAEYLNSMAIEYDRLGWEESARAAVRESRSLVWEIPETHYNSGVLKLIESIALSEEEADWREAIVAQAGVDFDRSLILDPAFYEALAMKGVAMALAGDCDSAETAIREALAPPEGSHRRYPVETGPGDMHAAGLFRRRHIESIPEGLEPERILAECGGDDA